MKESDKWNAFSSDYDGTVFSLTKYHRRRKPITQKIGTGVVINIGTGSTSYLNRDLINNGNLVLACDFCQAMLDVVSSRFSHKSLHYVLADSCRLPFTENSADNIVSVNSILPPERSQVQLIFNEACRVLKPRGKLVAFLPSFDCGQQHNLEKFGIAMDPVQQREHDTSGWQCYHTPETIDQEVKCAGFTHFKYQRVHLDSPEEISDLKKLYGLDTSDKPIYEYLLVAKK